LQCQSGEWVCRFLMAHQHNYAIQRHSRWFMHENTGQKTNWKYRQYINWTQPRKWIGLCMVLRRRQHRIGYMGDGFYKSKDPTNSIKVLKENLQRKTTQTTQRKHKIHICIHIQNSRQIKDTRISTASPLVYNNMGWQGDSSHRGQVARPEQWWGCRHGTPHNPEKAKQNYPGLVVFYDNRPGNEVGILHNVTEPTQGKAVKLWGHGGQ